MAPGHRRNFYKGAVACKGYDFGTLGRRQRSSAVSPNAVVVGGGLHGFSLGFRSSGLNALKLEGLVP